MATTVLGQQQYQQQPTVLAPTTSTSFLPDDELARTGGALSPAGRLRPTTTEASSKLYRDISPTRTLGASIAAKRETGLPDLFKQRGALQSLRPQYLSMLDQEGGDDAGRTPRLLARLELLLEEKLSLVNKVGANSKGFAATQMRTDAYRQAFDAFLQSFTTYRSILMRVKHEYDAALDDALASVYDNVHMRAELAAVDEMMDTCLAETKSKALEDAMSVRQELQDQYQQQEQVALQAERRCQAAETDIQQRRANIAALKREAAELMQKNRAIKQQMVASSSWAKPELLRMYGAPEA